MFGHFFSNMWILQQITGLLIRTIWDNPLPFPTIPTIPTFRSNEKLKFNDETDDFEFLDIELSFDLKIINEKLNF